MRKQKKIRNIIAGVVVCIAFGAVAATPNWEFVLNEGASWANAAEGRLVASDGSWELNAHVISASEGTLRLGKGQSAGGGNVRGNAFITGKIPEDGILDLRGNISYAGGTDGLVACTLTETRGYALSGKRSPTEPDDYVTELYLPSTLAKVAGCDFGRESYTGQNADDFNQRSRLEKVELISDSISELQWFLFYNQSKLSKVVLKTPKVSKLQKAIFGNSWNGVGAPLDEVVFDRDFDLSGVTALHSSDSCTTPIFGTNLQAKGCLRLPKLRNYTGRYSAHATNVWGRLGDITLEGFEVSTAIDYPEFPSYAFYNTESTNIVVGGTSFATIGKNAFASETKTGYKYVRFVGGMPTFRDMTADDIAFGGLRQPAFTMCFVAPKKLEWRKSLNGKMRLATQEEKDVWTAAYPGDPAPMHVVEKDMFRTATPQFVKWEESAGWTYDAETQTISSADGAWTLNVYVADAEARELGVGKTKHQTDDDTAVYGHAYADPNQKGVLDMTGPVKDTAGNVWTITELGDFAFGANKNAVDGDESNRTPRISKFYSPLTMRYMGRCCFRIIGEKESGDTSFGALWVNSPAMRGDIPADCKGVFRGLAGMLGHDAVIDLPNITSIPEGWLNYDSTGTPLWDADIGLWDISGVTNLNTGAFRNMPFKGVVRLPKLQRLGMDAFRYCEKIEGAELATESDSLYIGDYAFYKAGRLQELKIGARRGIEMPMLNAQTTVNSAFRHSDGCNMALTNVTFLSRPFDLQHIANIIGYAKETPVLRVSKKFLGWASLATPVQAGETPPDEPGFFGVLRIPNATLVGGARDVKAWLVDTPSPWDPKGFTIVIR